MALGLTACGSDDDFGGLGAGGSAFMDLRQVEVEGSNGSRSNPVVQTTGSNNGRFQVGWDVRSAGGGGEPVYRVRFSLLSIGGSNAGQSLVILNNRNCDIGVDTGCSQGVNSLPCDFDPTSNGTRMRCMAGTQGASDGGTISNVGQFFSQSVGLPGNYRIRVRTCAGFPDICSERDAAVRFE